MFSILRKIFLLTVTFISVMVCFNASAASKSATKSDDTIVVGVITQRDSEDSLLDSIGPFYGINLDYLSNIAKVLNLKLELRAYKHIPPMLQDVENGVIDGAVGFSKTREREKRFLFSQPFFSSTIAVWYSDANQKQRDLKNIKWVCVEGSSYCRNLIDHGFNHITFVKTRLEAFDEVRSGRTNALISTYVAINQYLDEHNIVKGVVDVPDWLNHEQVSFITSHGKQALVDQINKILIGKRAAKIFAL